MTRRQCYLLTRQSFSLLMTTRMLREVVAVVQLWVTLKFLVLWEAHCGRKRRLLKRPISIPHPRMPPGLIMGHIITRSKLCLRRRTRTTTRRSTMRTRRKTVMAMRKEKRNATRTMTKKKRRRQIRMMMKRSRTARWRSCLLWFVLLVGLFVHFHSTVEPASFAKMSAWLAQKKELLLDSVATVATRILKVSLARGFCCRCPAPFPSSPPWVVALVAVAVAVAAAAPIPRPCRFCWKLCGSQSARFPEQSYSGRC
mmetsp:Transcript_85835/g.179359  ORF Transcript_85835/g.179359 Transcript_85835/m.179359 type:complete len:255 (-) Transcript_85835:592-1356(-)